MSDERKIPRLWQWAVALLIGLPVLYVASFGPACWLADHAIITPVEVSRVFGPLAWIAARCPDPLADACSDYSEIFKPDSVFLGTGRAMIIVERVWPRIFSREHRPLREAQP